MASMEHLMGRSLVHQLLQLTARSTPPRQPATARRRAGPLIRLA